MPGQGENHDIIHTCDLMEFPLRSLAHKIYFLLKAQRSRGTPCAKQINKIQNFYN